MTNVYKNIRERARLLSSRNLTEIIVAAAILYVLLAASVAYAAAVRIPLTTVSDGFFDPSNGFSDPFVADPQGVIFIVQPDVSFAAANIRPETTLAATPISGTAPLSVVFTALCQDPDGLVASCVLTFGDGTNQILSSIQIPQIVQHVYRKEGNYLATLTAVDDAGAQDQTPAIAAISVSSVNLEPQTELTALPVSGTSPLQTTFIAKCSDADGTISSCELEFGDGETAVLKNTQAPQSVVHTYVNTAKVNVIRAAVLKARDDKGASDSTPATRLITVTPGLDKSPQTDLDAFPKRGRSPLEVSFVAKCDDALVDIASCVLEFGDGNEETLLNTKKVQEVRHVYVNTRLDDQQFKAKLRATNSDGLTDPTPAIIQVTVETDVGRAPHTVLSATPQEGLSPLEVTFTAHCTDLGKHLTQCRLDFGDGTSQNLPLSEVFHTVKHVYRSSNKETFIATLNAKNQEGLVDLSPDTVSIFLNRVAGAQKTFEFNVDVKNVVEEKNISARKKVSAGLFSSSELKINIPESRVEKIILEVKDTNNKNDLVISLDSDEVFRSEAEIGTYVIPVGEDFEGIVRVRAESPGILRFWESNFYDVRVTVVYKERSEQSNEFSFALPTLSGVSGGQAEIPAGAKATLNDVPVEGEISRNMLQEFNTVRVTAQENSAVRDKAVLKVMYG